MVGGEGSGLSDCYAAREVVIKAGFNYENIREDRYQSSRYGLIFEKILDELLKEIGIHYKKYSHKQWNPDYLSNNNV
ncbi:hypothetical protein ACFW1J_04930 [Priestia aryabhattai]|uniref:hypothetical protein n=1 Tax=Priestia TaxID=2800373 RepID=UPI00345A3FDA